MKPKFSSSSFIIIIIIIFMIMISNTIIVAADKYFVQKTCRKCEKNDPNIDYNFCVSSFHAHPGSNSADLRKLGVISFCLIQNNVTNSVEYVEKLLQKKEGLNSYNKARLDDCLELYSDAIVNVEDGKEAYKAKRYNDANIKLSSVMDAARVCEDGFAEKDGVLSPLTKWNKNTFQLTAITLSIINMHP